MRSLTEFGPNRRGVPYWQAGILVLLTAWIYSPLLLKLAQQWWRDPNYTHGFFVPVFSLFLIWESREKLAALQMKPSWWGLVILVLALMALIWASISSGFFSPVYRFCF